MDASFRGDDEEVRKILRENPEIDVNWREDEGWTALHYSCLNGHDKIVSMLLSHPSTNVNARNEKGETPFFLACYYGKVASVRLFLNDRRGNTPLYFAAGFGFFDIIQLWIASGRELDLGNLEDEDDDVIGAASMNLRKRVMHLLERFRDHPQETRREMRIEINRKSRAAAADMFALVLFLCDGLLAIRKNVTTKKQTPNRARFFMIARQLPLELQMVLCYRLVGSPGINIPAAVSEAAFKQLAKTIS